MRLAAVAAVIGISVFAAPTCKGPNEILNDEGTQCTCLKDFLGIGCQQCRTEAVCNNQNKNSHCAVGFSYTPSMKSKTYSCVLSQTLQAVFNDGAMGLTCDTTAKTCMMAVYKTASGPHGEHAVDCNMKDCSFSDSTVNCKSLLCVCTDACSTFSKSLFEESLANKPVSMVALSDTTVKVNIEDSPLPLEGICTASSCEDTKVMEELAGGDGSSSDSTPPPAPTYSKALIVSLSAVVSLLGAASFFLCCFYTLYQAKLRQGKSLDDRALEDPLQTNGFVVASTGEKFAFSDIYCTTRTSSSIGFISKVLRREAPTSNESKTILHEVSGSVHRGQLLGLMGPSGSGKTTLLNALAGVANGTTEFSGSITLDGEPLPPNYRQLAAYVHQDDCLFGTLTVRESIEYSAFLRLPSTMPLYAKQALVSKVLEELHLTHVADSRIGNANIRGISGGERRRVSIGMELVTQPQMLFLDEPTSGLDSASANSLVALLSHVAKTGRIVVLSVHQPSTKSFMKLDKVLLLAKGKIMYSGPSTKVASHFSTLGLPCPENENIADHILDCATMPEHMITLHEAWRSRSESMAMDFPMNLDPTNSFERADDIDTSNRSMFLELQILFLRTIRTTFRQKSLFLLHVAISVLLGIGTGVIFMGLQLNLAGFQNRMGAFYFILTFFGFGTLSSMDVFINERPLFLKETGGKYYGAWSYYLAKACLDLFSLRVIPAILFACIFYYIMGLNAPLDRFLLFTTTLVLYNVAAGSLSIFISILSKTVGIANLFATVVLLVMVLFGGFLLNVQTMSNGVAWIQWISLFKYAFEIMMTNELTGLLLSFDADGYPAIPIYGEVFLRTIGMNLENQMRDVVCLICITIVLHAVSFLVLYFQVPRAPRLYLRMDVGQQHGIPKAEGSEHKLS